MRTPSSLRTKAIVAAVALVLATGGASSASAEIPVDLELALAVDVSSSVTLSEYSLQMIGLAAAFRHPDVVAAIESLDPPGLAVCVIHWSGAVRQKVVVDWTLVSDRQSAAAFGARIRRAERSFIGETSIGRALAFSAEQIETNGFDGRRRTIDLSGDGSRRYGPRAQIYRDRIVEQGITINGLAILTDDDELDQYYRDNVIGGPGAFVISAADHGDFARAIVAKLIREIIPRVSRGGRDDIRHAANLSRQTAD